MFGLAVIDLVVIGVYFGVVIGIGIWAARRVRTQEDYFLASRGFGKLIQTFAAFGQATNTDTPVSASTSVFANGASGVWASLTLIFATPFYWLTSPWYRRMRVLTLADFFKERYGSPRMALLYACVGAVGLMLMVGLGINAMGVTVLGLTNKTVEQLSPVEHEEYQLAQELITLETKDYDLLKASEAARLEELRKINPRNTFSHINRNMLICTVSLIIIIYGAFGGLRAAFLTDLLQGSFIIILSLVLLPFAMAKTNAIYGSEGVIGAFTSLHSYLPQAALEMWGSPQAINYTWYFIAVITTLGMLNVAIEPNQLIAIGSAKDEFTGRVGFVSGTLIKRMVAILWGVFAMYSLLLYSNEVRNPDMVWGHASRDLLSPLGLGLIGLMIACFLSALMSTADCMMITGAGLFTHNIYKPLVPNRSEKHYVNVARLFGIGFILGSALIAAAFTSIFKLLLFIWGFYALFAASFWLGMLWRRARTAAAWISIIVTGCVTLLVPILLPAVYPHVRSEPELLLTTQPRIVEREYTARQMDVERRDREIEDWRNGLLARQEDPPAPLRVGEQYTRRFEIPGQSVFWTDGIEYQKDGTAIGKGLFNADLWLLHSLGMRLDRNVFALNDTIRMLVRILLPFGIIVGIGLFSKPCRSPAVDRFFIKMHTPVDPNPQIDRQKLEAAYADPSFIRDILLFPNSAWEFGRFNKVGVIGFILAWLAIAGILGVGTILLSGF